MIPALKLADENRISPRILRLGGIQSRAGRSRAPHHRLFFAPGYSIVFVRNDFSLANHFGRRKMHATGSEWTSTVWNKRPKWMRRGARKKNEWDEWCKVFWKNKLWRGKTKGGVLLQPWAFLTTKNCWRDLGCIYKRAGRVDSDSGVGAVLWWRTLVDADRRERRGEREKEGRSPSRHLIGLVCMLSMLAAWEMGGGVFWTGSTSLCLWMRRISWSRYEEGCGTKAQGDAWAARQSDGEAS